MYIHYRVILSIIIHSTDLMNNTEIFLYFNCFTIYTSNIFTNVFRVKRIELELGKPWYK